MSAPKKKPPARGKYRYVVDVTSTACMEVWADTDAQAKELAEELLESGSAAIERKLRDDLLENAQVADVTREAGP